MTEEQPSPPRTIDKETVLLAFESAISSLLGMRQLLDLLLPDGVSWVVPEPGECPHVNRAPSDPTFCLDCEREVGVSSGFSGGDSA